MLVIGIAGGSGSGKTTVVKKIIESIPQESVSVLSQDSYYKDNGNLTQEEREAINFDHPDAIEWPLLTRHIEELKAGRSIEMPTYSYVTCRRGKETIPVMPSEVIIVASGRDAMPRASTCATIRMSPTSWRRISAETSTSS